MGAFIFKNSTRNSLAVDFDEYNTHGCGWTILFASDYKCDCPYISPGSKFQIIHFPFNGFILDFLVRKCSRGKDLQNPPTAVLIARGRTPWRANDLQFTFSTNQMEGL
jgi:hypothetical protein